MIKIKIYNQKGVEVGEKVLNEKVFGLKPQPVLVEQAVAAERANARQVLAHTKTKGEVRGGGRKPWKQKGTGRARQGSIRAPQWRGGGIIFGPRSDRNFTLKINKKSKNAALRMVLSDKVANDAFLIVEKFAATDGKTSALRKLFSTLPVEQKKTLVVLANNDVTVIRAVRNLAKIG